MKEHLLISFVLLGFLANAQVTISDGVATSGNSDHQKLSIENDSLKLQNGGAIDLSPYLDNSDGQTITTFELSGNILSLTLSGGNTQTVDLSGISSSGSGADWTSNLTNIPPDIADGDDDNQLSNAQVVAAIDTQLGGSGWQFGDTNTQLTDSEVGTAATNEGFVTGSHTTDTDDQTLSLGLNAASSLLEIIISEGNTINIAEDLQDEVGNMIAGNTETGIDVTYDDFNNKINFDVTASIGTIADGSINISKISSADGTNDQILTIVNGSVEWANAGSSSQKITDEEILAITYTPLDSDKGRLKTFNNISTLTVSEPTGSYVNGDFISFRIGNTGSIEFDFVDYDFGEYLKIQNKREFVTIWYKSVAKNGSNWSFVGPLVEYIPVTPVVNQYTGLAGSYSSPEATLITGWNVFGNGTIALNTNLTDVRSGTTSLQITDATGDTSSSSSRFTLPATADGATMSLSFYGKAPVGSRIGIRGGEPNTSVVYVEGTGNWELITLPEFVKTGTAYMYIYYDADDPGTGNGSGYVDDITVIYN